MSVETFSRDGSAAQRSVGEDDEQELRVRSKRIAAGTRVYPHFITQESFWWSHRLLQRRAFGAETLHVKGIKVIAE